MGTGHSNRLDHGARRSPRAYKQHRHRPGSHQQRRRRARHAKVAALRDWVPPLRNWVPPPDDVEMGAPPDDVVEMGAPPEQERAWEPLAARPTRGFGAMPRHGVWIPEGAAMPTTREEADAAYRARYPAVRRGRRQHRQSRQLLRGLMERVGRNPRYREAVRAAPNLRAGRPLGQWSTHEGELMGRLVDDPEYATDADRVWQTADPYHATSEAVVKQSRY